MAGEVAPRRRRGARRQQRGCGLRCSHGGAGRGAGGRSVDVLRLESNTSRLEEPVAPPHLRCDRAVEDQYKDKRAYCSLQAREGGQERFKNPAPRTSSGCGECSHGRLPTCSWSHAWVDAVEDCAPIAADSRAKRSISLEGDQLGSPWRDQGIGRNRGRHAGAASCADNCGPPIGVSSSKGTEDPRPLPNHTGW